MGELVQVRSRRWIVEAVTPVGSAADAARVSLACADDDAQGQSLEVYWTWEPDRRILEDENWAGLASRGFDPPGRFAAFLHTLRWHCTTATDPQLFQAPFRAGIRIDAYQLEPLRKALRLPRVNLFIADDTGLGKTIEAGLIARELLLRRKVNAIVVAAPPSVLEQWKSELEERFGLVFELFDRAYVSRMRRERGFGVNPWRTHSRFLVSHNLLVDPAYADPLREWLGPLRPGSLLILDEAHHAAPSSGGRYGIETKLTRAVRDLGGRFEHRLFLSATPHNGHSNSFSTLLELLDPYRFTRGVKVRGRRELDDVMVRRLKEDVRELQDGFPRRVVERIEIAGLPADAPELVLSRLLDEYREAREQRHRGAARRARAAAGLLVVGLQQRLLSSIEAFARSLAVHRATVERQWRASAGGDGPETAAGNGADADGGFAAAAAANPRAQIRGRDPRDAAGGPPPVAPEAAVDRGPRVGGAPTGEPPAAQRWDDPFLTPPDADDERGGWDDGEIEAEENERIAALTGTAETGAAGTATPAAAAAPLPARERRLLDRMQQVADRARGRPDAKTRRLVDWIRANLCPGLPPFGEPPAGAAPRWNDRRVLVFTENRQGTKRYLRDMLEQAVAGTDRAGERIETIDGLTGGARRREIQRRFNADPARDPLRILLATDAAREGLNFQAHCTDLFHFDLPWNPGRIEQRNGRIDRKLQPAPEVRCHYFVLSQRAEDRVLEVLVRKTGTIKAELGSLSKVIDDDVERRLNAGGIRHRDAARLARELDAADVDAERRRIAADELEAARERQDALHAQIDRCRDLLDRSGKWVGFEAARFRDALSCSLDLLGADPLRPGADRNGNPVWTFPPLDRRAAADPTWTATLDTLRAPRKADQKLADWRRDAPIRPVVFQDPGVLGADAVHLHLGQRVAQRLLARFRAQGFVHHDLSRACLAQAADAVPRVVLLGRLSLYGRGAERLHEEIVPVAARWTEPSRRTGPLKAYAREAEVRTLDLLDRSLARPGAPPGTVRRRLLAAAPGDIAELLPQLEPRAAELAAAAADKLRRRGEQEAGSLRETLERQRTRVRDELRRHDEGSRQAALAFSPEEQRQARSRRAGLEAPSDAVRRGPRTRTRPPPRVLRGPRAARRAGRPRLPVAGDQLTPGTDGEAGPERRRAPRMARLRPAHWPRGVGAGPGHRGGHPRPARHRRAAPAPRLR